MDAILFKLLGAAGWGWENKEWLTLLGIFYASVKLQHRMTLQKAECIGDFKLIFDKISTISKTSDKAENKATEAIEAVKEMKPKVDDIHKWFEDKYKNVEKESSAIN